MALRQHILICTILVAMHYTSEVFISALIGDKVGENEGDNTAMSKKIIRKSVSCPKDGKLGDRWNSVVHLTYPDFKIQGNYKIGNKLDRFVEQLPQQCSIVIMDCPQDFPQQTLSNSSTEFSSYSLSRLLLQTISNYNVDHAAGIDGLPVLKVWFRFTDDHVHFPGTTLSYADCCPKFAMLGNSIFPGTVSGFVKSDESYLMSYAIFDEHAVTGSPKLFQNTEVELGLMSGNLKDGCVKSSYELQENILDELRAIYHYTGKVWTRPF